MKGNEFRSGSDLNKNHIITADMIRCAGLIRLSDIFNLVVDWDVVSIEGFKWIVSANGLSSFQKQKWLLLVDGQRMDVDLINIKNLNMLPLSIDQIDSVEIISTPQIFMGEFVENGLIHFYTSRPKEGFSVKARNTIGNESGDPGPFQYTQYKSRNVDRLGPDYSFHLSLHHRNNFVRTSFSGQDHYSTDPAILDRKKIRN